jgi:hypothetical protein
MDIAWHEFEKVLISLQGKIETERETYLNGKIKFDKFIEFISEKEFCSKKMVIK